MSFNINIISTLYNLGIEKKEAQKIPQKDDAIERAVKLAAARVAIVTKSSMVEATDQLKSRVSKEFAAAGFNKRWTNALKSSVYPQKGYSLKTAGRVWHSAPYSDIFSTGGSIAPKRAQFLWIPTKAVPFSPKRRITPRIYERAIGPLQFVRRRGKSPLLIAVRKKGERQGKRPVVLYVGRKIVTIQRKVNPSIHLFDAAKDFAIAFEKGMKDVG